MRVHRTIRVRRTSPIGTSLVFLLLACAPASGGIVTGHLTDGIVAPGEWTTPTTAFVPFPFDSSTGAGGATLYVDQGSSTGGSPNGGLGSNLYLLYDYVNATSAPTPNTFFDVFFQVQPENTDYLVRIMGSTFTAFEKPDGVPAPTPGGGFDPTQAPWTPLSASDLTLAGFVGAVGFGQGVTPGPNHQIAEFQLTINGNGSANPTGIYDPSPAFWSASTGGAIGPADPPISSGIFQLNPDGTTNITPVLVNGDPILQPQAVPEPSSLVLASVGLLSLVGCRLAASRQRRQRTGRVSPVRVRPR
jgi:hypothetical protein